MARSLSKEAVYEFSVSEQGEQLLGSSNYSANKGWVAAGRYQYGVSDNIAMYSGFMAQKREQMTISCCSRNEP